MEKGKPVTGRPPLSEDGVREYPSLGKYRVRLVANTRSGNTKVSKPVLDIREYVKAESFEGFTRRGIRLTDRTQLDLLRDVLKEILEGDDFKAPVPKKAPK